MDSKPYFMPQNPYLSYDDVTIRQQLTFPDSEIQTGLDMELKSLLIKYGFKTLLDSTQGQLDAVPSKEWVKKLSPGEKQTLAFIRLLYHQPKLAFLDEASSALSVKSEAELYEECQKKNIQLVSIGHRPTLRGFHQKILNIGTDESGGWSLQNI